MLLLPALLYNFTFYRSFFLRIWSSTGVFVMFLFNLRFAVFCINPLFYIMVGFKMRFLVIVGVSLQYFCFGLTHVMCWFSLCFYVIVFLFFFNQSFFVVSEIYFRLSLMFWFYLRFTMSCFKPRLYAMPRFTCVSMFWFYHFFFYRCLFLMFCFYLKFLMFWFNPGFYVMCWL